jgi:hypothetical protein
VDDTDLLQVNDTVDEVVEHMQQKLNEWNELVGVTGGILAPPKCWWYLVTFQYISGKWKAVSPQENFQLWLTDESKKRVTIDCIDPSVGNNMLGVHLAPDGNTTDHVQALRGKAERWVKSIQSSRANTEEVWTAMHRTIPFSICYSLPAVTLSKDDCRYITAPLTKHGLSCAGIVSTIPSAVKVGSISMGGLGIVDPYIHMGVSQIENFISNTWQKTPTGILQEISLDDFALELGVAVPWTHEALQTGLKYAMTNSWIRHMVKFSLEFDIKIDFRTSHMFRPKRTQDKTIMDIARGYTDKASTLQSINKIRMALQVIWISDILTADGRNIDPRWLFPVHHKIRRNEYQWPLIHHLSQKDWQIWRAWAHHVEGEHVMHPNYEVWQCAQSDWVSTWDSFTTLNDELLYISPIGVQDGQDTLFNQDAKDDCLATFGITYVVT